MKSYVILATLFATAFCYADQVDEDFPRFEDRSQRAFLVTVTHHIHAYKSEDRLMMEKKSGDVKSITPPKVGPNPVKVKMFVQPKKKFWDDPKKNYQSVKYNVSMSAKKPF